MIEIGISQFFGIVLLAAAVLAGLSAGRDLLHERRAARALRRDAVRCRICGAVFRRPDAGPIQSCPHCGRPSRSGRDRRLG
jgi:rubrerythrin